MNRIWALFRKDVLLEIRQQYALYGVLLYVGATTFVLYMAIDHPQPIVWNGLFWLIQLFISVNAVAKSFLQETRGRMLYYYSITSPRDFILSKILFNTVLMTVMGLLSLILFSMLMSFPVIRAGFFIAMVMLGTWSLCLVFTFLAALAARAQQNAAIMAILGFPILIPQLIVLLSLTATAFDQSGPLPLANLLILLASDVLVILLSVILFPFLWKD